MVVNGHVDRQVRWLGLGLGLKVLWGNSGGNQSGLGVYVM